ncbi:hypothetical protein [Desulfosporosinus sp. SB140]|uniref:hypothetical protein n=1 Tax=Desulfosporosinus paludis TaxID=3115649 RepID=UPI00388D54BE
MSVKSYISPVYTNSGTIPTTVLSVTGKGTIDWARVYLNVNAVVSGVCDIYVDGVLYGSIYSSALVEKYYCAGVSSTVPVTTRINFKTGFYINLYKNNSPTGDATCRVGYTLYS